MTDFTLKRPVGIIKVAWNRLYGARDTEAMSQSFRTYNLHRCLTPYNRQFQRWAGEPTKINAYTTCRHLGFPSSLFCAPTILSESIKKTIMTIFEKVLANRNSNKTKCRYRVFLIFIDRVYKETGDIGHIFNWHFSKVAKKNCRNSYK